MTPPPAPNDKAYKWTCRGNELYERRLYAEAIQEYSRVINDCTGTASNEFVALVHSNRSVCYLLMKNYNEARDDAARAIRLAPSWAKGYFRLGEVYMKIQQYDDAIRCYKDALEKDPDNTEISSRVAKALLEKDNQTMGLSIIQLMAGRDIATERHFRNPIQNRIYEFARVMRNIIYIVADEKTKSCVLVDAARQCWDIDGILRLVDELGYNVVATSITHHHFDHVGGSPPAPYDTLPIKIPGLATLLKKLPHIKAYVHPDDIEYIRQGNPGIPANKLVSTCTEVTEVLEIGRTRIRFIPTPGHTPGSQSLLVNDCRLLAGDTLLCGFCGRTDLPGGDKKVMEKTLRQTLGALDDRVVVYPGHHYGSEWSTVGIERDKGCLGEDLVGFGSNSSPLPSSPSATSLTSSTRKLTRSLSRKRNK